MACISLIVAIWAAAFVQKKNGGLVLILLSIIMLLFGGGLIPPKFGVIAGARAAYTKNQKFFEVRKDPWLVLPDGLTVFLGLGLWKSESEEVVDFETFQKMMKSSLSKA